MIDIKSERLLTMPQAAALLPGGPSLCTLWRWRTRGSRGRTLETIALSGKVYTSIEALQRFAAQQGGCELPTSRSPAARDRAIRRAEAELDGNGA